jgi:hypothetical protein
VRKILENAAASKETRDILHLKYGLLSLDYGQSGEFYNFVRDRYRECAVRLGLEDVFDRIFKILYDKNILPYIIRDCGNVYVSKDWLRQYYSNIHVYTSIDKMREDYVSIYRSMFDFNERLFINMLLGDHSKEICSIPIHMLWREGESFQTTRSLDYTMERFQMPCLIEYTTKSFQMPRLKTCMVIDYCSQPIDQRLLKLQNDMRNQAKLEKLSKSQNIKRQQAKSSRKHH